MNTYYICHIKNTALNMFHVTYNLKEDIFLCLWTLNFKLFGWNFSVTTQIFYCMRTIIIILYFFYRFFVYLNYFFLNHLFLSPIYLLPSLNLCFTYFTSFFFFLNNYLTLEFVLFQNIKILTIFSMASYTLKMFFFM